jgi:Fur family ferric uptake transcriptional regulator
MSSLPERRNTRQREAIRSAVEAAGRPLSPNEVLESAQKTVPALGIATVYRNLRMLQEEGEVVAVELPGDGVRYELSGLHHHHHFSCTACGRVFDVEGCPGNLDKLVPSGFQLERHEVLMFGRCAECLQAA